MATAKLINKVYQAVGALKLKVNNEQPLKMLQAFEEQEGGNYGLIPVYGVSLTHYIGYEVEAVASAVEELPVSYFNLCFKECIPMGGFSAYPFSVAIAMHVITLVLESELNTVSEFVEFMQNIFTPLAYNEV
jgi:hypothetical protein|nr:MAG TPA: hypothetical protein [Caudoviricetes sp.]